MAAFRIKAGALLTGERIQITADALDGLGNLFGGALTGSLKEQVLDKVRDAVERGRLIASADSYPQSQAHASHVRHLGRGDSQAALEAGDLVHDHPITLATLGVKPTRR